MFGETLTLFGWMRWILVGIVVALLARVWWLSMELDSVRQQMRTAEIRHERERARDAAQLFSARQLAEIRKEAPHVEINRTRGRHTLDF